MARTVNPERQRRITEEIVVAAEAILREDGLAGITVGRVARALDLTPGALYRYFASKDALIAELHRRAVDDFRASIPASTGPLPGVWALVEHLLAASADTPERFALIAESLVDPRQLVSDADAPTAMGAYLGLLAEVVTRFRMAREAGALSSGDDVERSVALFTALVGPLSLPKLAAHRAPIPVGREVAETVATSLLVAWGASQSTLASCREEAP